MWPLKFQKILIKFHKWKNYEMTHEVLKLLNLVPKLLTNIQTQIRDFRHHR